MRNETLTGWKFRRNTAILLSLAAAYFLCTEFIIEPWAAAVGFVLLFAISAAIAVRAHWPQFELQGSSLLLPLGIVALWGPAQLLARIPAYRFDAWWSSLTWMAVLACFWCALQVFSPSRLSDAFRSAAIIFGALIALEAIVQLFSGDVHVYGLLAMHEDRLPMGPFRNRDHFCSMIELILPLALWKGVREPRRAWISFTAAGVMYSSVIASASRAGAVIATLEIMVLLFISLFRQRGANRTPALPMIVAIAVVVTIGGGVVGWSPLLDRFQVKDMYLYRREFLESTLRMIHDRPWFGFGLGSWPWVYPRYAIIDPILVANHAHNDWVEWAAAGGIPFAMLLGIIAVRACWLSIELPWGIGTVAVFAHCTVDFPLARPHVFIALVLVLAVMELEHARRRLGRTRDGPLTGQTEVERVASRLNRAESTMTAAQQVRKYIRLPYVFTPPEW